MATRENLIRVRRVIAEFKIYITRTQSYLAPLQLFMIFLIFLNTTVWNVNWIQGFFGTKMSFISAGVVVFVVGVLLIGYVDTRLKIFRVELGAYNKPDRNPHTRLFTLWTALFLSERKIDKKTAKELEIMLEPTMKEAGLYEEYQRFKNKLNS